MTTKTRGGTNKLTDKAVQGFIRGRKAGTEPLGKLADGKGLYLMVTPAGTAVWRIKFRHAGKEGLFAVGVYPDVTLEGARRVLDTVRAEVKAGTDPVQARRVRKVAKIASGNRTFAAACAAWLKKRKGEWSEIHYKATSQALERDILPTLGPLPVAEITAPMLARVIERVVGRGANETAGKILWSVKGIFALAQTRDGSTIRENPAVAVRAVLTQTKARAPRPALLEFAALGDVLRRTETAPISPAVRLCLTLVAHTAVRIGNAVEAQWKELDLGADVPTWVIPREKMKMNKDRAHDHTVLLGPTITAELKRWKSATGGTGYVFPSPPYSKQPHVTREALEKFYRVSLKLSGVHSVHGWRSSFATLAKEAGFSRDVVELSLDHIADKLIVRTYDRGQRLDERLKLVHWWDAALCAAQHGGDVLPFRRTGAA